MGEPGFDVEPERLRAVAAGLRDDAGSVREVAGAVEDAVTPVHSAGGALAAAVSTFSTALVRATGAAGRDLEHLAESLDSTAVGYRADDQAGATGFGELLSRRLPPPPP